MLSKRYKEFKYWSKFIIKKWELFKPIFSRFWKRLKHGFSLNGPDIRCHYALHEHYLTGMSQGSFAILSGLLQRFGINFVPIPEFTSPMLYVRGDTTAIIKPWRLVWAMTCMIFEGTIWKELWQAIKWYWNRRKK